VVDVGDDGDIAKIFDGHGHTQRPRGGGREMEEGDEGYGTPRAARDANYNGLRGCVRAWNGCC
jgi:hypothetical protein